MYPKVKIDGTDPKGRLVTGPYKPICSDCAMYFSITVRLCVFYCCPNICPTFGWTSASQPRGVRGEPKELEVWQRSNQHSKTEKNSENDALERKEVKISLD